jgi:hypothetical protein
MSDTRLIHYHIYKNAGSSIDRLLQQSFGSAWTSFEGRDAADVLPASRLSAFLEKTPTVRAVSSHLARPPLPSPNDKAIVMLRHPIDRVYSVYAFAQRDPTQPDHHRARARSLAEYVRWALDSTDGGVVIRNYQTIHLSQASFRYGHIYRACATEADLQEAKDLLAALGVFGLVRRFADSCAAFMRQYRDAIPELRMFDVRENTSQPHHTREADVIERVRTELGPDLYRRLVCTNELDIQLYEWAKARFDELA